MGREHYYNTLDKLGKVCYTEGMNKTLKVRKAEVWSIVSKVFPHYRGRKFVIEVTERVAFYDTNWSGGTRNKYAAVRLEDGKTDSINAPAPWVNPVEGKAVPMLPGVIVVEHSIFQGKDCGIRLHVHPENMARLLPAPKPQDHICRDEGYSPHVRPCGGCMSQMSQNGGGL